MTPTESQSLKYGDVVMYHDARAIVQRVMKNGVLVSYDGQGPKKNQYVTKRVSATYLKKA